LPFQFENFVFDPDRRELRRAGELVAVEPQVFDVINYLICNRDRVVTRDNLLDAVWKGRVVSESTLSSRINAARRALSDSGDEQRLIKTVARKGLRFVGAVEAVKRTNDVAASPTVASTVEEASDAKRLALPLPDRPAVAMASDHQGRRAAPPAISLIGLVEEAAAITAAPFFRDAVERAVDALPAAARRDDDTVRDVIRRTLRRAINERFGKRPLIETQLVRI